MSFSDSLIVYFLLETVAVARAEMSPPFIDQLPWLQGLMFSSRDDIRNHAAHLYAIVVATAASIDKQCQTVQELTANIKTQVLVNLK